MLPAQLQHNIETLSGVPMSDVRVHYASSRPARLNARAFAQGRDIHLGPGENRHLPHEAWHVVQQARGQVPVTAQFADGTALNDNPGLEHEADVMGGRAAALHPPAMAETRPAATAVPQIASASLAPVQRTIWRYSGKKWVVERTSSEDDEDADSYDKPKKKATVGDRYDQDTGTYFSRKEWSTARLKRAKERAEARDVSDLSRLKRGHDWHFTSFDGVTKKNGGRYTFETPFGTGHVGRGKYNTQPLVGLEKDEWPNKKQKLPPTNYDSILATIENSKKSAPILNKIETFLDGTADDAVGSTVPGLNQTQKQVGTLLTTLLAVAEPHEERNPFGGKVERASVAYAKKHGLKKTYNRKDGAFVPSWATKGGAPIGGTGGFRQMFEGTRAFPEETLDLLSDMSESSSEEEVSSEEEEESSSEDEESSSEEEEAPPLSKKRKKGFVAKKPPAKRQKK